ncbi:hepatoma-derived growth factor-related protein 2-like [Pollicipes pollicipes]|uniref:hepatoma-derived growth factor-related protein 2-like n=1 Tax=Pollicipes pollicipes TaxID=41117 RepID=UPI0018859EA5|nr:hepatoma-derived growth factor-related protein 2-like [Pollicipes pollicipes]
MSSPSDEEINDEAKEEIPSTEVPTTESDLKPADATSSTIATGSVSASSPSSPSSPSNDTSNSADASGSGSSSSVKKSSDNVDASGSTEATGTSSSTSPTSGSGTGTTGDSGEGGSDDADKTAADDGDQEDAAEDEPPPPPPRPKSVKKSRPPPQAPPAGGSGATDPKGDVSMQYEQKFKSILHRRRLEEEAKCAEQNKDKPTIEELNSYFKAWHMNDREKRRAIPRSHDKAKKRRQEEVRQTKAQEAFCTWLRYKKQQMKMERCRWRLQCKERRQLVQKRSRAVSEAAYQQWLASKRQHCQPTRRGSAPPVVYMRDMSTLNARSYRAAMADRRCERRCASACDRRRPDEYVDVENVYCPEHKTEYRLETKRTRTGSCYRLTSVRKLDI